MLMRRAMKGTLQLIHAFMGLQNEILAAPSFEEPPSGLLAEEERVVANAKKTFLLAAGVAVQKYREGLEHQQEVVGALANIVMEVYAMESSLRRTQKSAQARGEQGAAVMIDAARAFIYDSADRLEKGARTALAASSEGDMLRTQMAVLKRFSKREPVDTIALRRRVAAAVLAADKYPFEAR